eukprot:Seg1785.3 transcript_id=Seg1785.3/GoldUCD/mRNA.D3Y31 product=Cubilin protein_id=Seg1785.3/GoldUCD/D3Y31
MELFVSFLWKVVTFGFLLSYFTDVSMGKKPTKGHSCHHILIEKEGYIKSPNYPNTYPNNFDCTYTVAAGPGQVISLDIEDFFLEASKQMCNFDYLMIYDGKDRKAPLLRTFCGRAYPETIYSSGNRITLQFSTDDDGRMKGFRIKYKIVEACYKVYTDKGGEIKSLGYPSFYPNNFSCKYVFKVPEGQSVYIKFTDFYLEKVLLQNCFDYVQMSVWNGTGWGRSGDVFCANEPPNDICVDSKDVMIYFTSDNIITKRGFKAVYEIKNIRCDGTKHEEMKASVGLEKQSHFPAEATDGVMGLSRDAASHQKLKHTIFSSNTKVKSTSSFSLTAKGLAVSTVLPSSATTTFAATTDPKISDKLNPASKSAFASKTIMENIANDIKVKKSSSSIPTRIFRSTAMPNAWPMFSGIQLNASSWQKRIIENQSSAKVITKAKLKKMLHTKVETSLTEWNMNALKFSKTESDAVPIATSSLGSQIMIFVTSDVTRSKGTALTTTILKLSPSRLIDKLRTEVNYDFTLKSRIKPSPSLSPENFQTTFDTGSKAQTPNFVFDKSSLSNSDISSAAKLRGMPLGDVDSMLLDTDASVALTEFKISSRISFTPHLEKQTQISSMPKLDAPKLFWTSQEYMNTVSRTSMQASHSSSSLQNQEESRSASTQVSEYGVGRRDKPHASRALLQPTLSSPLTTSIINRITLKRREGLSSNYRNKKSFVSSSFRLHQKSKSVHASALLVPTKRISRSPVISTSFSTSEELDIADLSPTQSDIAKIIVRTPTARTLGTMRIPSSTKASESQTKLDPERNLSDTEMVPSNGNPTGPSHKEAKIIHSSVVPSYLKPHKIKLTKAPPRFFKVTEHTEVDVVSPTIGYFLTRKKSGRTAILDMKTKITDFSTVTPSKIRQNRQYSLMKESQGFAKVTELTEADVALSTTENFPARMISDSPSILNIETKRSDLLKPTPSKIRQNRQYRLMKESQGFAKVTELAEADVSLSTTENFPARMISDSPSILNIETKRSDLLKPTPSKIRQNRQYRLMKESQGFAKVTELAEADVSLSTTGNFPARMISDSPSILNIETKRSDLLKPTPSKIRQNRQYRLMKESQGFAKVTELAEADVSLSTTGNFPARMISDSPSILNSETKRSDLPKPTPSNIRQTRTEVMKAPQRFSTVTKHTEIDMISSTLEHFLTKKKSNSPSIFTIESKRTDLPIATPSNIRQNKTPQLAQSVSLIVQLKEEKSLRTNYGLLDAGISSASKMKSGLPTASYEIEVNNQFTATSSYSKQFQKPKSADVSAIIDLPLRRSAHHSKRSDQTSEELTWSRIPSATNSSFLRQTQKPGRATTMKHRQTNIVLLPTASSSNCIKSTEVPTTKPNIVKKNEQKRTCRYPWPARRLKFMHLIRICPASKRKGLQESKSIPSKIYNLPSSKEVEFTSSSLKYAVTVSGSHSKTHLDESSKLVRFDPSFGTVHSQLSPKLTVDPADDRKYLFSSSLRRDVTSAVSDKKDALSSSLIYEKSVTESAISIDSKNNMNADMKTGRSDTVLFDDFSSELPIRVALHPYTTTQTHISISHTINALISGSGELIRTPVFSSLDAISQATETAQLPGKLNTPRTNIANDEFGNQSSLFAFRSLVAADLKLLETITSHEPMKLLKSLSLTDRDLEAKRKDSLLLERQSFRRTSSVTTGNENNDLSRFYPPTEYIPSSAKASTRNTKEPIIVNNEAIAAIVKPSPSTRKPRPYKTMVYRQDVRQNFVTSDSTLQLSPTENPDFANYRSIGYGYSSFDKEILLTKESSQYKTPPLSSYLDNDSGAVQNFVAETSLTEQIGMTDKQLFTERTKRTALSTPKSSLVSSKAEEQLYESTLFLEGVDTGKFTANIKQRQCAPSSNYQDIHDRMTTKYFNTLDLVPHAEWKTERPDDASLIGASIYRSSISNSDKSLLTDITDKTVTRVPLFLESLLLSVSSSVRSPLPVSITTHLENEITTVIDANSRKVNTSSTKFEQFSTASNQHASSQQKYVWKKESTVILEDRSRIITPSIILRLSSFAKATKTRPSIDFTTALLHSSTSAYFVKSTKSVLVAEEMRNQDKTRKGSCSGHFIADVDKLRDDNDLKWKALDILSLKLQRMIAIRWPYDGYLGRIGFLHRGYVVETKDGRLWYSHVQEPDEKIYVVSLGALADLHKRVRITYSHKLRGITLGEHTRAWGLLLGMYIRDCKSNLGGQ